MQNLKTRFRKFCWGVALLRECNVSANRMQSDESWLSKAMLRCSLTSRMQRYNLNPPKSNFFCSLISHLKSFPHPQKRIQPFIYRHSDTFSTHRKKTEIGILSPINYQNVKIQHICPHFMPKHFRNPWLCTSAFLNLHKLMQFCANSATDFMQFLC